VQADWTLILLSATSCESAAPRKMPPRSTTYQEALWTPDKPAQWTWCIYIYIYIYVW
jgi:hypothetical protein